MTRKETTDFLRHLLIKERLSGMGKYWASEVSLDYGTVNAKRVDFIQFEPAGASYQSDIEKGIFTCYEVKSCIEDVYNGNGLNFFGEKNYIVTTMETYKKLQPDMRDAKLWAHIKACCPDSSPHYGFLVPVPWMRNKEDEYENPTSLDADVTWEMKVIFPCRQGRRKRSTTELLFCMLRSGH